MWLEDVILKQAEKKLLPYRIRGDALQNEEYQSWLPHIREAYARATYWHGTGRYHYSYEGESRYESVNGKELLDVLDSIIRHDGLTPHHDPWIDSGGNTVSLGTVRMHSRLFARAHLYEYDDLLYELGSTKFWVRLYAYFLLVWLLADLRSCRQILRTIFRRSAYRNFQTWASALRKPQGKRVVRIKDLIEAKILNSDINGNYPILIGIAKGTLEVIDTIPLTHRVEVRSLNSITVKDFTHVEVPLARVEETNAFLNNKDISLPVLPMEFVDIYLKDTPLKALAYS
jgi:hypothetical protein